MKHFLDFTQWLNESSLEQTQLQRLLNEFARFYVPVSKTASANELQFIITKEECNWPNMGEFEKLGKEVTKPAEYKAEFLLNSVKYKLTVDFDMICSYQNERDLGDPTLDNGEMGVKLENMQVKKIQVESQSFNETVTNLNQATEKAVIAVLMQIMTGNFDVFGEKITQITH